MKDAPFEGFHFIKFLRSPIVALVLGSLISMSYPEISGKYLLLATAGGERMISEFYKKILKGRIPGKFKETRLNGNWRTKRKWLLPFYAASVIGIIVLVYI